jgi:hypothetical protein
MNNKNQPYIKQYDQNGKLLNPLSVYENEEYESKFPNRKQRRAFKNQPRFIGNNKGTKLILIGQYKYKKAVQIVNGKDAGKKVEHYIPCFKSDKKEEGNDNIE